MIPKHEDLGDLVTTPTTWHRRVHGWWTDEDKFAFEETHGVAFRVVDRDNWSTAALWGFEKSRPLESLIEENGEMTHREETWKGRDLGITFANGVSLHYNAWDDEEESRLIDALPVEVCNVGRCEGIIKGNRCETKPRTGDFCSPCKKRNSK